MKSKIKHIIFSVFAMLFAAQPVSADIVFCGGRGEAACTASDLFVLLYVIVNFLISAAGLVALLFIVWGGLQMLISAGNPAKIQEAKTTIWHSILGLVIVMLAYLVIGYVAGLMLPGVGDPLERLRDFAQ